MYSLLIVDDEPLIVEGIQKILAWEEYGIDRCTTKTSPVEALDYVGQHGVDILITDIRMPEMDGNELIRRVKAIRPTVRIIVLSGHNDFEYVRTASLLGIENYLLKPVDLAELEKTLYNTIRRIESDSILEKEKHENRRILRENILNLWINGNLEPDVVREKLQFVGIDLPAGTCSAVVIRFLSGAAHRQAGPIPAARLAEEICAAELCAGAENTICFCNGPDELVIVRSGDQPDPGQKSRGYGQLAERLHVALGQDVFICAGPVVCNPSMLSASYNAARLVANSCYYLGFHAISCSSDDILRIDNRADLAEPFRRLRLFAIMNDLTGAIGYVSSLIKKVDMPAFKAPELYLIILYHLYIELEMSRAPERNKALALRASLPPAESIHTAAACLEAITASIELLKVVFISGDQSNSYVARMKKIAQNNYSDYLSLKTMSEEFDVSASYLGNLFTQETGETFSAFLNRIRIEKAKLLLMNRAEKIADISRMTGFTTVNYFCSIFKKHTGLSPAEYRDQAK